MCFANTLRVEYSSTDVYNLLMIEEEDVTELFVVEEDAIDLLEQFDKITSYLNEEA